jgi:biotin synthase
MIEVNLEKEIFMNDLDNLFETTPDELFIKAREMSKSRHKILASPSVICGDCKTIPQCKHCKWRRLQKEIKGWTERKSIKEVVEKAIFLEKEGITRLFLPSGWVGYSLPDYYFDYVKAVKKNTTMEIFGLFGAIDKASLYKLKNAGMDGYLCGLESPDEKIYKSFRPGGDTLSSRLNTLYFCNELELKIWTGFIYGLGETDDNIKEALTIFKKLNVDSISILPFEPFPDTDMAKFNPPNLYEWAKILAITKIYLGEKINLFTLFNAQNVCSFGVNAGANGYYFFPGSRP